jgi:predicted Rossmann fold nucleotide-binding protein DprA/Smf involved in DNA uptake
VRLAVVGSTRFANPHAETWARDLIRKTIVKHQPDVVISGGADGVDTWAEQEAEALGYTRDNGLMVVHLPANRRWAPDGFQARNQQIAEDCTHLLAIRCERSRTYGSGWTADHAEKAGRQVHRKIVPVSFAA